MLLGMREEKLSVIKNLMEKKYQNDEDEKQYTLLRVWGGKCVTRWKINVFVGVWIRKYTLFSGWRTRILYVSYS